MSILQSIILGIIQGITEFLPVSSSAHLVVVPFLLDWNLPEEQAFIFDVLVQVATLVGVIAYFWSELWQIGRAMWQGLAGHHPFQSSQARLGWFIILANIPTGLIGLLLKEQVEQAFGSPTTVAFFLLITAGLLYFAELLQRPPKALEQLNWLDAIWIGLSQGLAIFPGVSRSGATITGGMLRGLERPSAARFSFLLSLPIMLAAGLLTSLDLFQVSNVITLLPTFIPGFVAAAVVGYLSIHWLLKFLTHWRLTIFSIYCTGLAILILLVAWLRT